MSEQAARAVAMTRLLFVLQPRDNDEIRIVGRLSTEWPVAAQELLITMMDRQLDNARKGLSS